MTDRKISEAAASYIKVAAVHCVAAAELEGYVGEGDDKARAIEQLEETLGRAISGAAPPERDEQEARGLLRFLASQVPDVRDVVDVETLTPVEAFHLVKQHLEELRAGKVA